MKRVGLFLVLLLVASMAIACGHQISDKTDEDGGDGTSTPGPSATSGAGAGATALTVTITDTGVTVDNVNLSEGPINLTVVNNATAAKSFYLVPIVDIAEIPIDSDDQVDVLNPPSAGGVKIAGKIENVPAGGSRATNIVVTTGKAVAFTNDPGDFSGGKFRAELIVNPK